MDNYALVYAKRFSVEELETGTKFYCSAAGIKLFSSTMTLADVLNGTFSKPEPERMQMARTLSTSLGKLIAALANPTQFRVRHASGSAAAPLERSEGSTEAEATARLKKLAVFYAHTFTADELNIFSAFYRSPFAQKMGGVGSE